MVLLIKLNINVYDFEFHLHFLYERDLRISTTEEHKGIVRILQHLT